jgi:hypothetical protein
VVLQVLAVTPVRSWSTAAASCITHILLPAFTAATIFTLTTQLPVLLLLLLLLLLLQALCPGWPPSFSTCTFPLPWDEVLTPLLLLLLQAGCSRWPTSTST